MMKSFNLQWPVESDNPTITKTIRATEIWDQIIDSAWSNGRTWNILLWDTM